MSRQILGLLIDIDGVLITDSQRLTGAAETIQFLNDSQFPYLLVTNTTRKSRITIWHQLKRVGISVDESQIHTAPLAAVSWLKNKGTQNIFLLLSGSAVKDFKDFKITSGNTEYVVIGDMGQDLTFERLNTAFRLIMRGAKIIALQKNRYWQTGEGLTMDAGAVVAALEYASRKRALVIGKPRKDFFLEAAHTLGIPPDNLAMIGDDLESDIQGAQEAGLMGIAVKTGKFRETELKQSKIKPDKILKSIAELPDFIMQNRGDLS